jgi:hypothetical protein
VWPDFNQFHQTQSSLQSPHLAGACPPSSLAVPAVWLAGLLQTALYADFFYYYVKSWQANDKLKLPA